MFKVDTSTIDEDNDAIRLIFPNPIHNPASDLSAYIRNATISFFDNSTPPVFHLPLRIILFKKNI